METLKNIGFAKVGKWELEEKKEGSIKYNIEDINHLQNVGVLYCFISDNTPYYFGITDKSLKERMGNYKSGKEENKSGSTNKKVHKHILNFLKINKEVAIYILFPKYKLEYEGFEISIYKGIEHSLIKQFDFDGIWNDRGSNSKSNRIPKVGTYAKNINSTSFQLKRGKELFEKGVIMFPKDFFSIIPKESCKVKLHYTKDNQSKEYQFTSSGNNRKINASKDLIKWLNSIGDNDEIHLEIINEKEFIITNKTNIQY